MIDSEMIVRLAEAGHGGGFANRWAQKYATDALVKAIFAMTVEDAAKILAEVTEARKPSIWPGWDAHKDSENKSIRPIDV